MTVTAGVGEDVTLTCMRQKSGPLGHLFWIRLAAGNFPKVLGGTLSVDYEGVTETPRITAKQEPGKFVLHIRKTKLSDTAVYYCIKVVQLRMTFLNGTFLRIKDPEPAITVVTQIFPSEPVYPGDSVALQCSLLSDSENKACPAEHNVFWFRAGSDESHPRIIYTHGNRSYGCEKSPEAGSPPQSCVYNFSKNSICSSDAGTYYCAVATCGEILFGNATKLDIEGNQTIFILTWKSAFFNHSSRSQIKSINHKDEDTLVYSSVTFTKREAGNSQTRDAKTAEGETIYADVRAFGWD
uniref:Ig-like domain-containing protein n=1 Tax=Myripristis murdjan TaxID=586833 RepID=A0A667WL12_9TELE